MLFIIIVYYDKRYAYFDLRLNQFNFHTACQANLLLNKINKIIPHYQIDPEYTTHKIITITIIKHLSQQQEHLHNFQAPPYNRSIKKYIKHTQQYFPFDRRIPHPRGHTINTPQTTYPQAHTDTSPRRRIEDADRNER